MPSPPSAPSADPARRVATALRRWVAALNARGDEAKVQEAFGAAGKVFAFTADGRRRGPALHGEALAHWLRSSPENTKFRLVTHSIAVARLGHRIVGTARYTRRSMGSTAGGTWHLTLSKDGTIARLEHRPDPLEMT